MSVKIKTSSALKNRILQLLAEGRQKTLSREQLFKKLNMDVTKRTSVDECLKILETEGLIIKGGKGRLGLPHRLGYLTGVLQGHKRGFAFLRPDSPAEDVYIRALNLNGAVHGDRVLVRLERKNSGRRCEGAVVKILKRGSQRFAGTLIKERKKFFVEPDDQRLAFLVQVAAKELKKARPGDKVVAEVLKWSLNRRPHQGRVARILGPAGSNLAELEAFKFRFGLPEKFPEAVLKAASELPGEEMIAKIIKEGTRLDLRKECLVTIDDETARDFDDAVSLEEEKGVFKLGVHISDVAHYVLQNKAIDREAFKRGTSTYLVEEAVHMLPPRLAEDLCSLKAGEERLALSVFMTIDSQGELKKAEFHNSVVKVAERLTYEQIEKFHNSAGQKKLFFDPRLPQMMAQMFELAKILRQRRLERGALDLDLPETKIITGDDGVPLAVEKRLMGPAEQLIEEFMVYCNETVAAYLCSKKLPCLYRVHAVPTEEKLALLRQTLTLMGVKALSGLKVLKAKHLPRLLEETKGERTEKLVRYLVLRSVPQAVYSAENEGHFGLASSCYGHFTAPIRRYPDLVVHRILKEVLKEGAPNKEWFKKIRTRLPLIAQHASERERAAIEAERASVEIKKAQFMEGKIGEVYTGIISGVAGFGFFVELDNTVEGKVPVEELKDDYYVYNERAATLTGVRGGKRYRLGDEVTIEVLRVNREEGQVIFIPADRP